MKDMAYLEQYLNDPVNEFVFENVSDTDHNGELSAKDLALLEQYLNGFDVDLQ